MLLPVSGTAFDLALKEEPRDVAGVRERDEQQVHVVGLIACGEAEGHAVVPIRRGHSPMIAVE